MKLNIISIILFKKYDIKNFKIQIIKYFNNKVVILMIFSKFYIN